MLSTSLVAVLPLAGLPTCSLKAAPVSASTPESFTLSVSGIVSRRTSFSGVLTGAPGKPRQGTFTITFAIYPVPEVGDPLWTETQQMTATPDGSRTEQPRSSASSGLPVTRLTHSIASAAYTSASHHLLFLRRSHSTGGVKDRDNYLGGEI